MWLPNSCQKAAPACDLAGNGGSLLAQQPVHRLTYASWCDPQYQFCRVDKLLPSYWIELERPRGRAIRTAIASAIAV
jgi:hypothetical protein